MSKSDQHDKEQNTGGRDKEMRYAVYMVRCSDGTLYTGYSTDLARRLRQHNEGRGAKYTRGRRPVELVYAEFFASKSRALSREHRIKSLSRDEKKALIQDSELPDPKRHSS